LSQPCIFELERGVAPATRPIGLTRLECTLRPRQCFAPPVQGHDTHTKRAGNFSLQFSSRRQFICSR
jgi:hypothetical protein